jgi:hypothetical protein
VWAGCGVLFALLATANAAGYRYGVSDQAFYIPVVLRALNPSFYPRDAALIDAQGRLMLADEAMAAVMRATGVPLDVLFFSAYLASLALIWLGVVLIGTKLYESRWAVLALGAALTLRHRIPRTSANSFEPYFHPRMFAFGVGLLALAALLRRRPLVAVALVAGCALVHVTTGIWFGIVVGVALIVLDRRLLRLALPAAIAAVGVAVWALSVGPLRATFVRMDAPWLQAVAGKDSLFASDWPLWAWGANLAMLALLWWAHRRRVSRGLATTEDRALVYGTTALVVVFFATLPLVVARLAFPVELQISRIFWLVDVVATIYVLAVVADGRPVVAPGLPAARSRVALGVASLLMLVSVARGVYVMTMEHAERSLVELHLPPSPWRDATAWLAAQPAGVHVLADPGHAWKYGTSVRVAAVRDVFLEDVKDSALAIYSRDVALRVNERAAAIGNFDEMTAERAVDLGRRYALDYLVTTHDLALPVAYRNEQFRIYALQSPGAPRASATGGTRPASD